MLLPAAEFLSKGFGSLVGVVFRKSSQTFKKARQGDLESEETVEGKQGRREGSNRLLVGEDKNKMGLKGEESGQTPAASAVRWSRETC